MTVVLLVVAVVALLLWLHERDQHRETRESHEQMEVLCDAHRGRHAAMDKCLVASLKRLRDTVKERDMYREALASSEAERDLAERMIFKLSTESVPVED